MTELVLVVGGFNELADALDNAGLFKEILRVQSTSDLRDLITTKLKDRKRSELIFLFADSMEVNTPQNLQFLCDKLQAKKWRIALLERRGNASDIVRANPQLGLIPAPHTLNKTLGALAGMEGVEGVAPVADKSAHEPLGGNDNVWETKPAEATQPATTERPAATKKDDKRANNTKPQDRKASKGAGPQPRAAKANPAPAWGADGPSWGAEAAWGAAAPAADPIVTDAVADVNVAAWGEAATPERANTAPAVAPAPNGTPAPTPGTAAMFVPGSVPGAAGGGGLVGRKGARQSSAAAPRRSGRMIVITAPKGGTGKSTLSINLAAFLGLRLQGTGKTVALVDSNFQQADTGRYLGTYRPNIRMLANTPLSEQSVRQHMVERPQWNLSVLLGPATPLDAAPAIINGKLYSSVMGLLRGMYDYVIVDTPVAETYHDIFDGFVLPNADFMIVAVTPNVVTLLGTDLWLRTITAPSHGGGRDFPESKIGVVLNQAEDGIECDEDTVRTELGAWNYLGAIPVSKEWKRAANRNEVVADKNYGDINTPLTRILYAATGEEILRTEQVARTGSKRRWWQRGAR